MASPQRRTQRGRAAAQPDPPTPPSSGRKRKRQQPVQHTDTTSDEGSSLDSSTTPVPPAAVPAASLTDIAALNDQSLSAVNQLLSKRYKKPVAHSTVAQPQRHEETKADEDEEKGKPAEDGAVWEADDTATIADAQQLQPIVAVAEGEHHDMDDDMWQTDDTQHTLQPPHTLDQADHTLSHSDNDDDHHGHTHSHRPSAEEAEAYRQQQLEAIASSPPPSSTTQLSHAPLAERTEVSLDDDNQSADVEAGGAISIELPKDIVSTAVRDKKADKAAAAAAKEKKKQQAPRLTARPKPCK